MFIADVTIGGDTKQINLINLQQSQHLVVMLKENMICVNLM
jgi:hypothetical protein